MTIVKNITAVVKEESEEIVGEAKKQVTGKKTNSGENKAVSDLWGQMLGAKPKEQNPIPQIIKPGINPNEMSSTPSSGGSKPEVSKYMQAKIGPQARTMEEWEKEQKKREEQAKKNQKERDANTVRNIQESAEKRSYGVSG